MIKTRTMKIDLSNNTSILSTTTLNKTQYNKNITLDYSFSQNKNSYYQLSKNGLKQNKIYPNNYLNIQALDTKNQSQQLFNLFDNQCQKDQENIQQFTLKPQTTDKQCQTSITGYNLEYDSDAVLNSSRISANKALDDLLQIVEKIDSEVTVIDSIQK